MQQLNGTIARYPWGTFDVLPEFLGLPADGRPFAELWLGAHPLSPSSVAGRTLDAALTANPSLIGRASVAEFGPQLPFLMKVLSARHALSLQAHPTRTQAEEGWAAEEEAGVPLTSPERVYRDTWPKPEILVALTDFHTLAGFRDPRRTVGLFEAIGCDSELQRVLAPLHFRGGEAAMQQVFLNVLALEGNHLSIVDHLLASALNHRDDEGEVGEFARTALELDETFPREAGILAALLLNRVSLEPGQAVFIAPRTMHAHLHGTGIEVMASSDNVIRGGLTNKHIAVDELVRVVDFRPCDPEILTGTPVSPGVLHYPTRCLEFDLWRLDVTADAPVELPASDSARIALTVRGEATLDDGDAQLALPRGTAAFIPADHRPVTATGEARLFLTAAGLTAPPPPASVPKL